MMPIINWYCSDSSFSSGIFFILVRQTNSSGNGPAMIKALRVFRVLRPFKGVHKIKKLQVCSHVMWLLVCSQLLGDTKSDGRVGYRRIMPLTQDSMFSYLRSWSTAHFRTIFRSRALSSDIPTPRGLFTKGAFFGTIPE